MEIYEERTLNIQYLESRLKSKVFVYEKSRTNLGSCTIAMIKAGENRYLIASGSGSIFEELEGETEQDCKICPLNHENRLVLNTYLPFTHPVANTTKRPSIGLGDRLGVATPGHIKALEGTSVFPIFAQQSIRELNFTNRTFNDVIDAASYAVFQEGYTYGFGADGDHLKKSEEIRKALEDGATMITLDSSEQIDPTIQNLDDEEILTRYEALDCEIREVYEGLYAEQEFSIGASTLKLDLPSLRRDILTYHKALDFIQIIYEQHILHSERAIDFEISIDETDTPTDPKSHLFIAKELKRRHVIISTLAPRFVGEFQKGIDYIGDTAEFERQLVLHVAIAKQYRYRLSIHSGSDKFSIFPILGRTIKGSFHVKTAGTNWLEAVRLVAQKDPALYRRMHAHATNRFGDAKAFYHVTTDIGKIQELESMRDEDLPSYLNDDNARQLLHITYGYLLEDVDEEGKKLFKESFFSLLSKEEEYYKQLLDKHISRHLSLLEFKK
nr:tagaturonate epimerase family protein [uncultured Sphaerochaeta sp.]